ncbi:efflux transporter outer membrane subunit [Neisseria wadsworthii]|uniref:Outer membrane multidrug resistance lipoprotein n=1 Tax=Neisseria wadsworthii 9715 TaxID=1030841 RepID=G4CTL4_9NEIS|nr:efflux transporter outer membrane subunit [Neisseria wadsworthii]EGZ44119.1 outer membrane multidrug resistance lipoprotein [Neisseria wadsworthii 9715]QMT35996.1 efflux transporter outer membrane subunit [Neisseria wadsworthii]
MGIRYIKHSVGFAALCLLGACAQLPKETALAMPSEHSLASGQTFAASEKWWLSLKDPQLNKYIDAALKNAPSLKIAQARFEQLQAELGIVDQESKVQTGIVSEGKGVLLNRRPSASFAETDRNFRLAHISAQAKWSFDFWGKNKARIASALGRRNAAYYEIRQAEVLLAHSVAVQYFTWQNLVAQQDILNQRVENAKQIEKLIQERVRADIAAPSAVYEPQQVQQQLMQQKLQLDKQIAHARHALAVLAGKRPDSLDKQKPAAMVDVPNVKVSGLKADILGRRPDIAVQRELLNMRSQNIREAKADFYPNVELKLLAGLSHLDAFDLVRGNSAMLGVVPALHLPIFTSGALRSKLAKRNAEYDEQVAIYDQTVLNAMRMAADAIADYQNHKAQHTQSEQTAATARKISASMLRRVNAGLENKADYYRKQDDVLQQQALVFVKHSEALSAWSNLHAQLGGGFREEQHL